jgi:hypothetical protein
MQSKVINAQQTMFAHSPEDFTQFPLFSSCGTHVFASILEHGKYEAHDSQPICSMYSVTRFCECWKRTGAASSTETDAHYTKAQLKELVRSAHTPEQYKVLASYYGGRRRSYLQEAVEKKREWDRRSQNVFGVFAKYPRPVDSARNLYEYYMSLLSGYK